MPRWMNTKQYASFVPSGVITVLAKKSHATSVLTCKRMNLRQTVSSARPRRVGEGVRPASLRMRRTEERQRAAAASAIHP